MANPANLLHAQLSGWNKRAESASQARDIENLGWNEHKVAVQLLSDIGEILRRMRSSGKNVEIYERFLPSWYAAVFSYPEGWTTSGSGAVDTVSLDHLETLSGRLSDVIPIASLDSFDRMKDLAHTVREAVAADDSLPSELRMHLLLVVTHLEAVIEKYSQLGDFSLADAAARLRAAIAYAETESAVPGRWRTVAESFIWPFAVTVSAAIPSTALVNWALGSP